jgi:alkaline phosphatase D
MYEQGYFTAHRHMAQEDLDLVVFLGDYIYEHRWGKDFVRNHEGPETFTLGEYRNRYACYKADPDLQLCHSRFPWIVTWDDHEVANDYAKDRAEDLEPHFLARRTAAYQAFYEHMPLPSSCAPHNSKMRIYQAYDFGRLTRFHVLDDRQYRDYEVCPKPGRAGSNYVKDCPERLDPKRTILGWKQEDWLKKSLKDSSASWDVIVQQTLMAQAKHRGDRFWTDGWDGYPAARRRLLEAVNRGPSSDTIVIGGDVHAYAVCDLKVDFDDPHSPTVATEFCGTSITSQGPSAKETDGVLERNPHIHYANGNARGYVRVALSQKKADVALRSIESEKVPETGIRDVARYFVEKGRPGPQEA